MLQVDVVAVLWDDSSDTALEFRIPNMKQLLFEKVMMTYFEKRQYIILYTENGEFRCSERIFNLRLPSNQSYPAV